MKKLYALILFMVTAFMFAAPAVASAQVRNTPGQTLVTGTVTNNGSAVGGATVSVSCNGHGGNDITDSGGSYLVAFDASDCPAGSTVSASATLGKIAGSNKGTANPVTTKLNIAVVDIAGVPEFGTIAGLTALAGGTGFMIMNRRRQSALS